MCGILLLITKKNCEIFKSESSVHKLLKNRGPDLQNFNIIIYENFKIVFYGSTLHLRGLYPSVQPLILNNSILLWNGEIFAGLEITNNENDGEILLKNLSLAKTTEEILLIFSNIRGPWAFTFYQTGIDNIWFGRDVFGRRSLVYHYCQKQKLFLVSSTANDIAESWVELPAIGIYCLNLSSFKITIHPWLLQGDSDKQDDLFNDRKTFCDLSAAEQFLTFEYNISSIGLTCPFNFKIDKNLPEIHSDDATREEIRDKLLSEENFSINKGTISLGSPSSGVSHILDEYLQLAGILENFLSEAVRIRVATCPSMCSNCISKNLVFNPNNKKELSLDTICLHSKCCILFSGGIDSLVIAASASRHIPLNEPIDLLNVMFLKDSKTNQCIPSDRSSSIEAVKELKKVAPNRQWNLVQIDIEIEELQRLRKERIQHLIYPLSTVLDDSIGCSLWFAARGSGYIRNEDEPEIIYTSPARVILSGFGADEQLAGYSRHRLRFKEKGLECVEAELKTEMRRISSRNLGRDDRIISDHGREVRFPFLDENLVQFFSSIPIQSKADLSMDRGLGEKLLLRIMAHKIGLVKGAVREKRAIQFGSGIAKMENRKEKGSDVCSRLI